MQKTFIIFFTLLFVAVFSQSKIIVKNAATQQPVAGALVKCGKTLLGKTNVSGTLEFNTECKQVEVSATGYHEEDAVTDKMMEVFLSKEDSKTKTIETVVISDKSDPRALEILNKVNENYVDNSPKSLSSYAFKSYEKISLDLDEDSIKSYNTFIEKRIDSLQNLPQRLMKADEKKDSLESVNIMKLMGSSKMFLWERASEFLYSEKHGEKINILDNKISGMKEPIYELIAFRSNRNDIPKEIKEENRNLYRFFLTDSIEIDGRQNYVIRFREVGYKKIQNNRKYNGYIYVDKDSYALKKIESNSKNKTDGSITSIWKPIDGKWFLIKENYKLKMGFTAFNLDGKKDEKESEESKNLKKKFGNVLFQMLDFI